MNGIVICLLRKINQTWNADELFIILSESQYRDGMSVPRAFKVDENMIALSIFTDYEAAVKFCGSYYIRDGKYLIGRIDKNDKYRDLYSILNTAAHLGITHTDIDCGTDNAMNIRLNAMFDWGGRKFGEVSVPLSAEEFENLQNNKGSINLRFNNMPIYNR